MSGFVGSRARKRRRNIFLSFGIFSLIVVIFLIFPTFENNNSEIIPNDNIIPNPSEELTSLASNIEELELNLFQKDQKIKFRDGQIKNLQTELKATKLQYDTVVIELNEIKNDLNNILLNSLNHIESSRKYREQRKNIFIQIN